MTDKDFEVEDALRFFSKICQEENVPVGIAVTMSGKFAVRFSLSNSVLLADNLQSAFDKILEFKANMANDRQRL